MSSEKCKARMGSDCEAQNNTVFGRLTRSRSRALRRAHFQRECNSPFPRNHQAALRYPPECYSLSHDSPLKREFDHEKYAIAPFNQNWASEKWRNSVKGKL